MLLAPVKVVVANVFRLDERHGLAVALAYDDIVGRAARYARRLVDGFQAGQQRVEQLFKRGAVAVFARHVRCIKVADFVYVFVKVLHIIKVQR